jgi:hypothetical protein
MEVEILSMGESLGDLRCGTLAALAKSCAAGARSPRDAFPQAHQAELNLGKARLPNGRFCEFSEIGIWSAYYRRGR